jgi:hypothetical protein
VKGAQKRGDQCRFRLCVECVLAAERSGLLQGLWTIAGDSMFVHFKESGKIFCADWMAENVASIFVEITQLILLDWNRRKLDLVKQRPDVTCGETKLKGALFDPLSGKTTSCILS